MRKFLILSLLINALAVTGCTIHKLDVQQGNVIDEEKVNSLEIGMNRRQVRFILGTPLLATPFEPNRWDYVYEFKSGRDAKEREFQRVTVFFEDDTLVRIERYLPDSSEAAG